MFEAPIFDSVKLAVTNVQYDDDSMQVKVADSVAPREELATRVKWDQSMLEGDLYHSVFWLGTNPDLPRNIGAVRVNMTRGADDVTVAQPRLDGDLLTSSIKIAANHSGEERTYQISISLAQDVSVASLIADDSPSVSTMQMATGDVEYKFEGNVLSWTQTQQDGASAVTFTLVLDASEVTGLVDITPVVTTQVSTSENSVRAVSEGQTVMFEGRPVFQAVADKSTAKKGDVVRLTATPVDLVISDPEISYIWKQVSGTQVAIVGAGTAAISFTAPELKSAEEIVFELVGSNGSKQSAPVEISVNVEATIEPPVEQGKSGGSMGFGLLLLSAAGLLRRRK